MSASPDEIPVRFVEAWNSHDMKALAALFAEDADFVNVVGMWWKSRGEIEAAHAASHEAMFRDSRLSGTVASVKRPRPDVAIVHMSWNLVGHRAPDGRPDEPRQGILVFVASNENGCWLARAAQNTDIVPL